MDHAIAGTPAETFLYGALELFHYPRSLLVSWLSNLGMQTTGCGVILWAPTLFVLQLGVTP